MVKVFTVGPRITQIDQEDRNWVRSELDRCCSRLCRRYPKNLEAMISLAPGIGEIWFEIAHTNYGIPVDSWAIHRDMGAHWANGVKAGFNDMIKASQSFRVAYPSREPLKPWMYLGHLRQMAAEADMHVVVWSGDQDDFIAGLVDQNKPLYWINQHDRRVRWQPDGYAV